MGLHKTFCLRSIVGVLIVVLSVFGCSTKNWTAGDWYGEGASLAGKGEHLEAIKAFTKAIGLDPENGLAYLNRGLERAQVGDYRQALDDFNKALSLHDKRVTDRDAYREIGAVYRRMGKVEDAAAAWQKALGKAKDDPDLLNRLAAAYLDLGQTGKAGQTALQAYAVDPSLPDVLNTMGEVAMARKLYKQAGEYFVQAIERERGPMYSPVASRYWNAALAFEKTKEHDKALEYARQYENMEQDPAARHKAYALIEKLKKAMDR